VNATAQFSVTLHHLSADGAQIDAGAADTELIEVPPKKLRQLLERFAALARKAEFPAQPELRVAGPHGRFLIQARNGQLRVVSWAAQGSGTDLTPERVWAMIMGAEQVDERPVRGRASGAGRRFSVRGTVVLLALVVIATNSVTAWWLTRPPPPIPRELLPEFRVVDPERGARILADFAGTYQTGAGEGDRRLAIARDGALRWQTLGAGRAVIEDSSLTCQAAESRGQAVLVAANHGMIEMKDPITVVYFGDTYRRTTP
jgi:hypothetical protein